MNTSGLSAAGRSTRARPTTSSEWRLRTAVTLIGAVHTLGRQWRMESRCEVV